MSTIDYCAYGCTVRDQHEPTCEGGTCRGCVRRLAATGMLCEWCASRLERALDAAPDIVEHLRIAGQPSAAASPASDTQSHTDPAWGDLLPAEWAAADELHALLSSWVAVILEEHPHGDQMAGPSQAGVWHTLYGTTVGVSPSAAENPTAALVKWLAPHLDWCLRQEWAAEMRREVCEAVATTSARWPTASAVEPAKRVDIPCPRCDGITLTYTPPRFARQAFRVECENPDCARVFSEDEWERFKALALDVTRRTA